MKAVVSRNRIRMRCCRRSLVLLSAAAALVASGAVSAQRSRDADGALELELSSPEARAVQDEGPISLEEAVELVRMRYEGRVVSAETETVNGRSVHVIRIFDDVRVRDIHVDAATGRIRRR